MIAAPIVVDLELGTVRLCRRCGEWWPLDREFWYWSQAKRGWLSWCRACWHERNVRLHAERQGHQFAGSRHGKCQACAA